MCTCWCFYLLYTQESSYNLRNVPVAMSDSCQDQPVGQKNTSSRNQSKTNTVLLN